VERHYLYDVEIALFTLANEVFREQADKDYIAARSCYRMNLREQSVARRTTAAMVLEFPIVLRRASKSAFRTCRRHHDLPLT
jgi:hypothetical protein